MAMSEPLDDPRWARLEAVLEGYGAALVAFSGGVDSSLVAAAARRVLGPERMLAVTGISASLSRREGEEAEALARRLDIPFETLETYEGDDPDYRANAPDRCFHCKTELFSRLAAMAADRHLAPVCSGDNLDDLGGHRPGLEAARAEGVRHPLIEAELGKQDIRELANLLGLPNHDKPAAPCLASRVPHGTEVTPEVLARIDAAEEAVRALGFDRLRVRHHGDLARLELPADRLDEALRRRAELAEGLRRAGYAWVSLDLEGLRSGSLQEVLPEGGVEV